MIKNFTNGIKPTNAHRIWKHVSNLKKLGGNNMGKSNPYGDQAKHLLAKWKALMLQIPPIIIKRQVPHLRHDQQYAYQWQMKKKTQVRWAIIIGWRM
jgi:hypothetical protein